MAFFDGSATAEGIRNLLRRTKRARIAVAYWGEGAIARLGIETLAGRDVLIVCDIASGACNPHEVEQLQKMLGKERVLMCDRLHAKVWLTDQGAIIGSSNASANGLGDEGTETLGLIEANVLVNHPATLEAIERWFNQSVLEGARKIGPADIEAARDRWKKRRRGRPVPHGRSLLQALRHDASRLADRDIDIWIWEHSDRDTWAEKALADKRKAVRNSNIDCWQHIAKKHIKPGGHVIEFDWNGRTKTAKFIGIWRMLSDDTVRYKGRSNVVFCLKAKGIDGLDIPRGERQVWRDAATRAMKVRGTDGFECDVVKFAQRFLITSRSVRQSQSGRG